MAAGLHWNLAWKPSGFAFTSPTGMRHVSVGRKKPDKWKKFSHIQDC